MPKPLSARAAAAREKFFARVAELGGVVTPESIYVDTKTRVPLVCSHGHACAPLPRTVNSGFGICQRCADTAIARARQEANVRKIEQAADAFFAKVETFGGRRTVETVYIDSRTRVSLVCARGHACAPMPHHTVAGLHICNVCAVTDAQQGRKDETLARFIEVLGRHGATLAPEATYVNNRTPIAVICSAGHRCAPRPDNVLTGQGPCRTCAGHDTEDARRRFLVQLEQWGAKPAPDASWAAVGAPFPIICAEGHENRPHPQTVLSGSNPCRTCAGRDSLATWRRFVDRLHETGWLLQDGDLAQDGPVSSRIVVVLCPEGHSQERSPQSWLYRRSTPQCGWCVPPTAPRPSRASQTRRGGGGRSWTQAEQLFWDRVTELGGIPDPDALEPQGPSPNSGIRAGTGPANTYIDAWTRVSLLCPAGHRTKVVPVKIRSGAHLCLTCLGRDPAEAEVKFWAAVAEAGARPAPGSRYVNSATPVNLICKDGHKASPRPGNVRTRGGVCASCRTDFDRVYLLRHEVSGAIKVGISGRKDRVTQHERRGYALVALWTGLDAETAYTAEQLIIRSWREDDQGPVPDAPEDGRTETAPIALLNATRDELVTLLGEPNSPAGDASHGQATRLELASPL